MLTQDLSELERDALTELVNIAISGAVSRLRAMAGSEVNLTVPIVEVLAAAEARKVMAGIGRERMVAVRQGFEGRIDGQAMLVFNEADSRVLARSVMGEGHGEADYAALYADTLGEVGNVLLLGLLATIGSMLGLTFEVTLPDVLTLDAEALFPAEAERVIMLIHVNFSLRQIDAKGYFSLVLGLGSFEALRDVIGAFIRTIVDD